MIRKIAIFLSFIFLLILIGDFAYAGNTSKIKYLKEKGYFISYGEATLKGKENYQTIPVGIRFGFDTRPLIKKIKKDINIPGSLLIEIEPFVGSVINPNKNVEFGCGLLLKYGKRIRKVMPYIETGSGIFYTTQHTRDESTQWNFLVQAGAGLYYFLKENTGLNLGYRYRHFSNAGIKYPNNGVDVHLIVCGLSHFY